MNKHSNSVTDKTLTEQQVFQKGIKHLFLKIWFCGNGVDERHFIFPTAVLEWAIVPKKFKNPASDNCCRYHS